MRKQVSVYVDNLQYAEFQARYPGTFTRLCNKALQKALKSRDFFNEVFFDDSEYNEFLLKETKRRVGL